MADAVAYPLLKRSRRRSRRPANLTRWAAAAILFGLLALVGRALLSPARIDPVQEQQLAREALAAHQWSVARDAAHRALSVEPRHAPIQLILARALVELEEGAAADAAVSRAATLGVPATRLHALRAAARLLQGDEDGAFAEAAAADRRDRAEAVRVQARALAASGQGGRAQALLRDLLAQHPREAAAWVDLGRLRLTAGDLGAASEAVARAVALKRTDPAAMVLQGEVLRSRLGLAAALPWFAEAARRDPGYHPALIEQAATLGDLGRYREMLAASRQALVARPGSPQALYLQAVLAARAGRPALARAILDAAGPGLSNVPGAQLLGGAVALLDGNAEQAVATWRDLVGEQPDNVAARRLLSAALLRSDDAAGALATIRPVATRADADSYSLEIAARAMAATGDRATAAILHDRAMKGASAPSAPFASDVALGTLQAAVAGQPTNPSLALALLRGQLASGQGAMARQGARGLAAQGPGAPAAQQALGDVLLSTGDATGAASAFARAADLRFDEPAMLRLIDADGRAGRAGAVAGVLAAYLSQNGDSLQGLRLLGHWQVAARQWPAAIRSLERVRRRAGERDAALLADLALAYAGAGRAAEGRAAGAAAYRIAPGNISVCRAYAVALAVAGDGDGARQLETKVRQLSVSG